MEIPCPKENCKNNLLKSEWQEIIYKFSKNKRITYLKNKEKFNQYHPQVCQNTQCKHPFYYIKTNKLIKQENKGYITCPFCQQITCYKCKQNVHFGIDCNEVENAKKWTCQNNQCSQIIYIPQNDKEPEFVQCYHCKFKHCYECGYNYHKGLSCSELNMDSSLFQMMMTDRFKPCPQCQFWVSKSSGCNHMTCKCGFQFCYKCGSKYRTCKCKMF